MGLGHQGRAAGKPQLGSQTSAIGTLLAAVLISPIGRAQAGSALVRAAVLQRGNRRGTFYFENDRADEGWSEALTPMQLAGIPAVVTAALGATLSLKTPVRTVIEDGVNQAAAADKHSHP